MHVLLSDKMVRKSGAHLQQPAAGGWRLGTNRLGSLQRLLRRAPLRNVRDVIDDPLRMQNVVSLSGTAPGVLQTANQACMRGHVGVSGHRCSLNHGVRHVGGVAKRAESVGDDGVGGQPREGTPGGGVRQNNVPVEVDDRQKDIIQGVDLQACSTCSMSIPHLLGGYIGIQGQHRHERKPGTLTAGLFTPRTLATASPTAGVLPMKSNSGPKTGLRAGPSVWSKGSLLASWEKSDSAASFCVLGRLLLYSARVHE